MDGVSMFVHKTFSYKGVAIDYQLFLVCLRVCLGKKEVMTTEDT